MMLDGRKSSGLFAIENELAPRDLSVNISCIIICREFLKVKVDERTFHGIILK